MLLPAIITKNWGIVEPAALAVVSVSGQTLSMVMAQASTTPAEYVVIFTGFLIAIGMGVLSIAGFTAHYMAKKLGQTLVDISGEQAKKLFDLDDQKTLDQKFSAVDTARNLVRSEILAGIKEIQNVVTELRSDHKLLTQKLDTNIGETVRLRDAVFRANTGSFQRP